MLFQRLKAQFRAVGISVADFDAPGGVELLGVVFKGVKPEKIKSIELRANGLTLFQLDGWFDDEAGGHVSAGVQAQRHYEIRESWKIEGGGVPLIFGDVSGLWRAVVVDGRSVHQLRAKLCLDVAHDELVHLHCEWLVSSDERAVMASVRKGF